ncbi:hypothetical protein [Paenirhodobacter hankyongi]|uniref:Lipoprotein n=1 Tax=Paenirhodobacter hankyongi TaxID=2294033 RepID=A0A421BJR1_9RHOB|nr:hypothetical protein [Sinirhodobacter hankyongi]RLL62666.1 hypothetical protein DYS74_16325 [Sinirhodobacter hankyongi]
MRRLAILAALSLAACAPPPENVFATGYNRDSVVLKTNYGHLTNGTYREAQRICRDKGLNAEYASTLTNRVSNESSHLFLCLNNPKRNGGMPADLTSSPATAATTGGPNYLESSSTL